MAKEAAAVAARLAAEEEETRTKSSPTPLTLLQGSTAMASSRGLGRRSDVSGAGSFSRTPRLTRTGHAELRKEVAKEVGAREAEAMEAELSVETEHAPGHGSLSVAHVCRPIAVKEVS